VPPCRRAAVTNEAGAVGLGSGQRVAQEHHAQLALHLGEYRSAEFGTSERKSQMRWAAVG